MEMGAASTLGDGHNVASTFVYTYPLEYPPGGGTEGSQGNSTALVGELPPIFMQ